jgi:type III secretion protein L
MDEKDWRAEILEKAMASTPRVVKREVYDATREAREIISQAQEKAKQMLEQALREREQIQEEARQAGNVEGLSRWSEILAGMTKRVDELTQNWEDTMLELSVHIAQRIIGEELRLHRDTIISIIREVMKSTRVGKRLSIQVNDAEAEYVRSQAEQLKQFLGSSGEIEIVPSTAVTPGGCVIESELGIIDARLETQLKFLEDALLRRNSAA